jgi:beta-galactosidase/beta-glucuronidase
MITMKQILHALLVAALLAGTRGNLHAQVAFGQPVPLNDNWKFFPGDAPGAREPGFDASRWRTLDLPHDWSVEGNLSPDQASCTGYLPGGIGWYRKTITIPAGRKGEKVYLYFEGIYNRSEIFLNGHPIGARPNGYISFLLDATPHVDFGKENVIAVRVDHSRSADSRWYTGSGIYRDAWIVYANPVHVAPWGVFAYPKEVSERQATLRVEVEVENGTATGETLTVTNELLSPGGKRVALHSGKLPVPPGGNGTIAANLKVASPLLWDLEHPHLYTLKTTVRQGGKVIDESTTTTGFRRFTFDPDKGFALNGRQMKMKGVCLHHDAGVLGAAVPRDVWKRRLQTLKEIGVNAIRTSHNPQAPALYDLCDEMGLLVLDEAYDEWEYPKNKWIAGWNVGTPGHQGSHDIFAEWGERDIADMVRRDRNHVSIFAWSIGNEVDYPNDPYSHPILDGNNADFTQPLLGGYKKDAPDANRLGGIAKRLVAVVKQHDPSRPVTAGLAGVAMSNETEYPGALDIAGYNYTESRYVSDHAKYPARVIFGSETSNNLDAWRAVVDNEHVFGQFVWTGIDYLGESGRWPSRGFYSGMLDFGGFIKPRGHFRRSLWSAQPVAYLGTYPSSPRERGLSIDAQPLWNYREGQPVRVVAYTNAAKARLELNGQTVGETKTRDPRAGIISWHLPFRAGKLEVIGLDDDDKEIVRHALRSSGRPAALVVRADKTTLETRGVAHVTVEVVDEEGIPVVLADNAITCIVEGPARLLGLEGSDNQDTGNYRDNVQRAYLGRLLAYIQATGTGHVKARFITPWLEEAEVSLEITK